MTQRQGPHELPFVLDVPATAKVTRHDDFDMYLPDSGNQSLPAVVFVPGPMPAEFPSPGLAPVCGLRAAHGQPRRHRRRS